MADEVAAENSPAQRPMFHTRLLARAARSSGRAERADTPERDGRRC